MSKKKKQDRPVPSGTPPKKTRAQRRREKKQAKRALLPLHKRPLICPPDKAGRHPAFRIGGYICRALVIWAAVAGLTIFLSSALEYGVSNSYIFGFSLLTVSLCALFCYGRIQSLIALAAGASLFIWRLVTVPRLGQDLLYGVLALFNGCLERLYRVGYLTYIQYEVPIPSATPTGELLRYGISLLILLFSVLFTLCLVRRVRLIPPAVVCTSCLVCILTFNIYSNRISSNLGIALVIASFAAILVMAAYDRLYLVKDTKHYDTELSLFEDSDRPVLPASYAEAEAARLARKEAKGQTRREKKHRDRPVTVEDELNDYFTDKKKRKLKPKKNTAAKETAGDPASVANRKEERKQVRAVRRYDRTTEQARRAMGGFMSAAACLVCLLAVALPAIFIKGNFSTIEAIDEKVAFARDYVTAVLRGDDQALDELEYQANSDNFKDRSTELEQLQFTGRQIFYVEARYNTNYYMTGWIGTDYVDGGWTAADKETFSDYRALFDTFDSPSETLRYNFYHYMASQPVDDPEYNENLLTRYKSNLEYGFVNVLFHARRVNSPSSLCYFPTTVAPTFSLYDYGTMEESELTYVNYFDGIRTGRGFKDNGISYASMVYAPVMINEHWSENVGNLVAAYTLEKEALLIRSYLPDGDVNADPSSPSRLNLTVYDNQDGTTLFTYTYKGTDGERIFRFYHDTNLVKKIKNGYTVSTAYGGLSIGVNGGRVYSVYISSMSPTSSDPLFYQYERTMTDTERTALFDSLALDWNYSDFVYRTYTKVGGSAAIAELADTIAAQVSLPMASVRNAAFADATVQRNQLVRQVIDYIIGTMGCSYTITPDLSSVDPTMDGVENFLFNTKEGYCVQFASAVALILREYGIPARYVEGYIASDLTKLSSTDFVYGGYVHDYQAHAWVEVYFDGIGWVPYETTPAYYTAMYGSQGIGGTLPDIPIQPPVETETDDRDGDESQPVETDIPETGDGNETEDETGDDDSAGVLRTTGIGLLVLVGLGAVILILSFIVRRAREAEAHRQSLVSQVLDSHFGEHTSEQDRREMALELSDAVINLLSLYGLSPQPGEFRDAYADRLTEELTGDGAKQSSRDDDMSLPDLHLVMEAIAAEEFGHGMTVAHMKEVATCYVYLRRELKRYIPLPTRLKLRYIKHMI